jgi:very-long-chain (3R)-3-hydroxyacyl-CoA dehydratase
MDKVINLVNLVGWTYLLVHIEIELVFNVRSYLESDITISLTVLRAMQLFQILDIVLLLMGKAKGNLFAAFFQILGRNIVTLYVMEPESGRIQYAGVVIVWSIAEVNRYLYYLFKDTPITGYLRYNAFLLLYPLGAVVETLIFNDYFSRHP